jgi:hypothetical protein
MEVETTMDKLSKLSIDDQQLLIEVLLNQHYAIEILSSELNDIETGVKSTDHGTYFRLVSLYDRLRISND